MRDVIFREVAPYLLLEDLDTEVIVSTRACYDRQD